MRKRQKYDKIVTNVFSYKKPAPLLPEKGSRSALLFGLLVYQLHRRIHHRLGVERLTSIGVYRFSALISIRNSVSIVYPGVIFL